MDLGSTPENDNPIGWVHPVRISDRGYRVLPQFQPELPILPNQLEVRAIRRDQPRAMCRAVVHCRRDFPAALPLIFLGCSEPRIILIAARTASALDFTPRMPFTSSASSRLTRTRVVFPIMVSPKQHIRTAPHMTSVMTPTNHSRASLQHAFAVQFLQVSTACQLH